MIDKFKTCKDCPDRCASPNCHMTCEGYLYRRKKADEKVSARVEESKFKEYVNERHEKIRKKSNKRNKRTLR